METESSIPLEKMDEKDIMEIMGQKSLEHGKLEKMEVMGQKSLDHGKLEKMAIQYGQKPLTQPWLPLNFQNNGEDKGKRDDKGKIHGN